jgi:hypothetical protein
MSGEPLHQFDLQLCEYVIGNVTQHFDDREFADWIRTSVPSPLASCLDDCHADYDSPKVVLGEDELLALETANECPPPELDREWLPYDALHRRYVSTLHEVRERLCPQAAQDWAEGCSSSAKRISARRLSLHDGITIVRDWLCQLRRLLLAMHATELVAAPQGTFPTPLHPAATYSPSQSTEAKGIPEPFLIRIEILRQIIRDHPQGRRAKPASLIKAAAIGNQSARNALRWLSERGEYEGFTRARPARFKDGRRNEK